MVIKRKQNFIYGLLIILFSFIFLFTIGCHPHRGKAKKRHHLAFNNKNNQIISSGLINTNIIKSSNAVNNITKL